MLPIKKKGFQVSGGILVLVAVVLVILSKRRSESEVGAAALTATPATLSFRDQGRDPVASPRSQSLSRFDRIAGESIEVIGTEISRILSQADPVVRTQEWLDFVSSIGPDRMEEVMIAFRSRRLEVQRNEYAILLSQWAKDDPEAAIAYVQDEVPSGDFERSTILARWAEDNSLAALAWAEQNPTGRDGLNNSILYVAKGIAASDPALAAQLLESQPAILERPGIVGQVIPQILALGVEEAKLWPDSFESPELKAMAVSKLAASLVQDDPEGTMEWISEMGEQGRDGAYREAVSALAQTNSEAALGYALKAPAGKTREEAFVGLIRSTTRNSPSEAAKIIDTYPDQISDSGIQGFVWYAVQREPTLAAEYVGRIEGDEARAASLRHLTANWRRKDPAALETWLKANPQFDQP